VKIGKFERKLNSLLSQRKSRKFCVVKNFPLSGLEVKKQKRKSLFFENFRIDILIKFVVFNAMSSKLEEVDLK
jgi:hypothetical protein